MADYKKTLQSAIDTYGESAQVDMMIEECSKLIKSLLKYRRLDDISKNSAEGSARTALIREEMADVQIMLWQMELIYGSDEGGIEFKLRRLEERLSKKTMTRLIDADSLKAGIMERLTYWNERFGCWDYKCGSGDAAKRLAELENCIEAQQALQALKEDKSND